MLFFDESNGVMWVIVTRRAVSILHQMVTKIKAYDRCPSFFRSDRFFSRLDRLAPRSSTGFSALDRLEVEWRIAEDGG